MQLASASVASAAQQDRGSAVVAVSESGSSQHLQASTGLPSLQSLVDPASIRGFFCGNAVGASICITPEPQQLVNSAAAAEMASLHLTFTEHNAAKAKIIQQFLLPALGTPKLFAVRTSKGKPALPRHELCYTGEACRKALQLLEHCPVNHHAAKLALAYLDPMITPEHRLEIGQRLSSHDEAARASGGIAKELITPSFIAGVFSARGRTRIKYNRAEGISLLELVLDKLPPHLLACIWMHLGYGAMYPAGQRDVGEHGAFKSLVFRHTGSILSFDQLLRGQETWVAGDAPAPATASGLPRAIGQTHKVTTLVRRFNGAWVGRRIKTFSARGKFVEEAWPFVHYQLFGLVPPDWEL